MNNLTPDGLDDLSGLNNESELPHLSETIVYEKDIAPYPFIGIHAGVGSGKNYFIDILARGYSQIGKRIATAQKRVGLKADRGMWASRDQ